MQGKRSNSQITDSGRFDDAIDGQVNQMIEEGIQEGLDDQQIIERMVGRAKTNQTPKDFVKREKRERYSIEPSTETMPGVESRERAEKSDLELLEEAHRKFNQMADDQEYDSEDYENLQQVAKFSKEAIAAQEKKKNTRRKKSDLPFGEYMKAKDFKETSLRLGQMAEEARLERQEQKDAALLQETVRKKGTKDEEFSELAKQDYQRSAKELGYFIQDPREIEGFQNKSNVDKQTTAYKIEKQLKYLTKVLDLDESDQKHFYYKLKREEKEGRKVERKIMRLKRKKEARELDKKESGRSLLEAEFEFEDESEEKNWAEAEHERKIKQFENAEQAWFYGFDKNRMIMHKSFERSAYDAMSQILSSGKSSVGLSICKDIEIDVQDVRLNKAMTVLNVWWDAEHILDRNSAQAKAYLFAIQKKLTQAVPYFRGQLTQKLKLKYAPELRFYINQTTDIYFQQRDQIAKMYTELKEKEEQKKLQQQERTEKVKKATQEDKMIKELKTQLATLNDAQREQLEKMVGKEELDSMFELANNEEEETRETKFDRKVNKRVEKMKKKYNHYFGLQQEQELPGSLDEAIDRFTENFDLRHKIPRVTKKSRPNPEYIHVQAEGIGLEQEQERVDGQEEVFAFDNDVMRGLAIARETLEGQNRPRQVKGRDAEGKRIKKKKQKKKKGDSFWESLTDF